MQGQNKKKKNLIVVVGNKSSKSSCPILHKVHTYTIIPSFFYIKKLPSAICAAAVLGLALVSWKLWTAWSNACINKLHDFEYSHLAIVDI